MAKEKVARKEYDVIERVHPPRPVGPGAKQSFKKEADINAIMSRYVTTGVLPPGRSVGRYGDFSDVPDYQASLERLRVAQEQFASLPSRVRERFKNDIGTFLRFVGDKNNLKEAKELGLLKEEVVVEPAPVKEAAK